MQDILPENQLRSLRNLKIINDDEIAYKKGDIIVAENVLTNERRIIDVPDLTTENSKNKRILKG
mgnify:CR=1 FL=1|tara:strand:- start:695 stop:886 length:192 start_codon:yes stop_codon:yes gene_type:complete